MEDGLEDGAGVVGPVVVSLHSETPSRPLRDELQKRRTQSRALVMPARAPDGAFGEILQSGHLETLVIETVG